MKGALLYVLLFTTSVFTTWICTPLIIRIAKSKNIVDIPYGHKTHSHSVPYLGGLAMWSGIIVSTIVLGFSVVPESIYREAFFLILLTLAFSAVGLVDDLKNLGPSIRLALEVLIALVAVIGSKSIDTTLPAGLDIIITTIWFVALVNAMNMIDNQDGLAAGQAVISLTILSVIAYHNDQILVLALCSSLIGSAIAFLKYNFHPAKIYMGDSGAYALGFTVAFLGVQVDTQLSAPISILIAPIVLAVPILDMTLVTTTRVFHRRHPFQGGQDHFSHRLIRVGNSKVRTVIYSYFAAFYFGLLALLAVFIPSATIHFIFIALASMLSLLAVFWKTNPGY